MRFNFFDWIREGVKQSVLLGVSDAAESIGGEKEVDHLNQRFLEAIQQGRLVSHDPATGSPDTRKTRTRKSLGRSLAQVMEEREPA
ncbi:MAG: hypothetical protein FJ276_07500 [Planctomycetes bacterium]|nr:hypothetical protein [Planctomycetota bacterium]